MHYSYSICSHTSHLGATHKKGLHVNVDGCEPVDMGGKGKLSKKDTVADVEEQTFTLRVTLSLISQDKLSKRY